MAKTLLSALAVQPGDLTIERLLLEYWRSRLAERGNLARHNITDFDNLLRAHAREWLEQGRREFDRDSWATYSGAARRTGRESVLEDLTEIEEGRFLTITSPVDNAYGFREDALPYALGLLIVAELREVTRRAVDRKDVTVDEALARMLDPVRGFDRISDIVAAAIGIAGWDDSMQLEVFRTLIRGWCSLQNTTGESDESALRHAVTRPEAVLDVVEQPGPALPPGFQSGTLTRLLLDARDVPAFAAALERRIPRWLGSWSVEDDFPDNDEAAERRRSEREERIRSRLAALTEAERSYLQSATVQRPTPPEIGLQRLSALLLARRSLAAFASGIVAWGFAQAVAGTINGGGEELAWVVRLNRMDARETTEAVRRLVAEFDPEPPTTRRAITNVLRLLGDDDSARRADELHPLQIGESRHIAQKFSGVNPYDPEVPPPTDLFRAREAVAHLGPDQVWIAMVQTPEEFELKYAIPPLARFEPDTIVSGLRSVVATVRSRSGLPLRQMAFRLPALSVILDNESLDSVHERLNSLLARPEDASPDDLHWILSNLTATLLPHLSATEQIDRLQVLPSDMPTFYHLGDGLAPVDAGVLEKRIADANSRNDDHALLWLLFHARFSASEPTERVRAEVLQLFMSGDDTLSMIAAAYVSQSENKDLDNAVVHECLRSKCPDSRYHRRAIAQAVVRSARTDAVHLVHREFIGYVAHALGGDAELLFREYIDRTLNRALGRTEPAASEGVELHLKASGDGLDLRRWGDERRETDLDDVLRDFADAEWAGRWKERQQRLRHAMEVLDHELATADAEYLAWSPSLPGLTALASRVPEQFEEWSNRILEAVDLKRLSQVRNLGLAIASACGRSDPGLAAAVFRKLASARSVWNVTIDGLDLYTYTLFSAGSGAEIDTLRREVFEQAEDDNTIASLVAAAERHAPDWLAGYIRGLLQSHTVADHALAITVEGFRVSRSSEGASSLIGQSNGFLGVARKAAGESARRSDWCEHWLRCMEKAADPIEFWRSSVLAQGTVDFRHLPSAATVLREGHWTRFANPILRDIEKAAEKIAEERERTLLGGRAPDPELRVALFPS